METMATTAVKIWHYYTATATTGHMVATTTKADIPDNEPSWRGAGCPETGKSGFEAEQVGRPTCLS